MDIPNNLEIVMKLCIIHQHQLQVSRGVASSQYSSMQCYGEKKRCVHEKFICSVLIIVKLNSRCFQIDYNWCRLHDSGPEQHHLSDTNGFICHIQYVIVAGRRPLPLLGPSPG